MATLQNIPVMYASYADVQPGGQMHVPVSDNDPFAARQPCVVLASKFMWGQNFRDFFPGGMQQYIKAYQVGLVDIMLNRAMDI